MQWKSAQALLTVLTVCLTLVGCRSQPGEKPGSAARRFDGVTLRVRRAKNHPVPNEILERFGRTWTARTGGKLVLSDWQPISELSPQQRNEVDVWLIQPSQLGEWATKIKLAPFPDTFAKDHPRYDDVELLPIYRDDFSSWNGRRGLPILGETPLCFYRRDLFKTYGLEAPQTWQQYVNAARLLHQKRRDPKTQKSLPSLPPLPRSDQELAWLFWTASASFARKELTSSQGGAKRDLRREDDLLSFYFDFHTGEPRIAQPGFVHALTELQKMQTWRAPARKGEHWTSSFQLGESALCIGNSHLVAQFQQPASAVRDKFGICQVPGSYVYFDYATGIITKAKGINLVPYYGGNSWIGVVAESSGHKGAAWDLIAFLGDKEMSQQILTDPRWGGGPIRREHWNEEWHLFQLPGEVRHALALAIQNKPHKMPHNPLRPLSVPRQAEFSAVLAKELRKALTENVPAETALRRVEGRWQEIIREIGAAEHVQQYRVSLGVSAK